MDHTNFELAYLWNKEFALWVERSHAHFRVHFWRSTEADLPLCLSSLFSSSAFKAIFKLLCSLERQEKKMPNKVQGELLPPGWKVSPKIRSQVSGKGSYNLNDQATLEKLKGHAVRIPLEQLPVNDKSKSLQFSTGAYIEAVSPLLKFWKDAEVNVPLDHVDTDSMEASVTEVEIEQENKGKTVKTIVRLNVEGEKVTITCYDTQVKMRVQGKDKMEEFFRRALLPYLEGEIRKHSSRIRDINIHFQKLGSFEDSKSNKTRPAHKDRRKDFKPSKVLLEQQLELSDLELSESDASVISVYEEIENEQSLGVGVQTVVRIEREEDSVEKVVVIPDETFCLENNLTPAPKAVWSNLNLPKGWNLSNNVVTSRSLPSAAMTAILEAAQAHTNPTEGADALPEAATALPTTTSVEDVLGEATPGAESFSGGEGAASPAERMESQVVECDRVEVGPGSTSRLVSDKSIQLDPWRPTHDTTGDVMRFLAEMRKQSARLTKMEETGRHMEQLMEAQGQTIVDLHSELQRMASKVDTLSSPHDATHRAPGHHLTEPHSLEQEQSS